MPKPTFHNLAEEKRARLVELAIEEFSEHPYDRASLSRIVERAGIAKGSVYQYFENKADLYAWLVTEEVGRRKLAYVEPRPKAADGDVFSRLEGLIHSGLRFHLENPRLARLAAGIYEPSADPEVRALQGELRSRGRAYLREMLAGAQAAGELRPGLDLDLAASLVSHVLGPGLSEALLERLGTDVRGFLAQTARARKLEPAEVHALVRGIIDFLRHGIGGPAPRSGRQLTPKTKEKKP
ncbi:MAG TPA: TetR/AcrR family transcriptional regulator [Myxococcaceae bacterium]|nr:TetR/AcrR family transcriptional regulator [Myxococcaceae bacterium]